MKKSQLDQLNVSLDKALDSSKRRKPPMQNLDALLEEYDDQKPLSVIPITIPDAIPASIPKEVKKPATDPEPFTYLDATHTNAEKAVYSIMYRETISKGINSRHFGPAELMAKSGIRSRNTVHKALYGLVEKLSIEVVSEAKGNPLGPRYKVHKPQAVEQRRKTAGMVIDSQSKRITPGIPTGIPAAIPTAIPNNWEGTIPEIGIPAIPKNGIVLNKVNNSLNERSDDEALAPLVAAARELTGKDVSPAQWRELSEVLATELKIAAARTTVSNVPAFLAEHLRRRLFKKDAAQLKREAETTPEAKQTPAIDVSQCPDCRGAGMFYPDGYDNGVTKCRHEKLKT